jgi:hypothetical protein
MTRFEAAEPAGRLSLLAEAVTAHRRRAGEAKGVIVESDRARVEYADRRVRLELDAAGRDRLEGLLGSFPAFKIKQPDTRKADAGVVYVSAVADAKRVADFLEGVFREVADEPEDYELRVVRL